MVEHLIQTEEAQSSLLDCAAFLAENITSRDGYASAMMEIVPFYLKKVAVDLAAQLSDSIDDPFVRDRLLSAVAEKCAAINDDEYAFQLVEAVEDAGLQSEARSRIAGIKAAAGEFEKAFEIAAMLEHPSEALGEIAYQMTMKNRESEAQKTLEQIDYAAAKVHALQMIASYYEENKNNEKTNNVLDEAVISAYEIDFPEEKIRVLQNLGEQYVNNGRYDKAIETFDKAKTEAEKLDSIHRDVFLAGISLGFLRSGSLELADRSLDILTDKIQIATCLLGFSREFWAKKELGEALDTLEEAFAILKSQRDAEIRDSRARYALFAAIAAQFAQFDKPERAIEIAQSIADEIEQNSALTRIAQISGLKNNDEIARLAINAIGEDLERMFALIKFSDAKSQLGKRDESIELLNEAATLAETVPQIAARSQAYNELAKRFTEYGEMKRAREISQENLAAIASIRDETARVLAIAHLSEIYDMANFELTDEEIKVIQEMIRHTGW